MMTRFADSAEVYKRGIALERKKKEKSRPPLVTCSFCSLQIERATIHREVVALVGCTVS